MAWAICESCKKEVSWRARRGSKLADLRCECGGRLRSQTAGRGSGLKGLKKETCVCCGRKGFRMTHPKTLWQPKWALLEEALVAVYPPGPACGFHEPSEWPKCLEDGLAANRADLAKAEADPTSPPTWLEALRERVAAREAAVAGAPKRLEELRQRYPGC